MPRVMRRSISTVIQVHSPVGTGAKTGAMPRHSSTSPLRTHHFLLRLLALFHTCMDQSRRVQARSSSSVIFGPRAPRPWTWRNHTLCPSRVSVEILAGAKSALRRNHGGARCLSTRTAWNWLRNSIPQWTPCKLFSSSCSLPASRKFDPNVVDVNPWGGLVLPSLPKHDCRTFRPPP